MVHGEDAQAHVRVPKSLEHAHPLSILDALSSKVHFKGVTSSQLCVGG